jgi:hypothetical protein
VRFSRELHGSRRLAPLTQHPISEKSAAYQSTSKRQACLVDIRSLFVSDAQPAKLIKPSEGSFYNPPPTTQSTAVFGVSLAE